MSENKPAESKLVAAPARESKATPIEPGPPVEGTALSQMGSTFAERAAARAKLEKRAVTGGDAENKAVSSPESKGKKA